MSRAGGLESALRDVEPILRGNGAFQFSHPSFREILVAKELADEINSGKVSVREAYAKIMGIHIADYNFLNPGWRPVMHHMVGMLSEENAREFVDTISDFAVECNEKGLCDFRAFPDRVDIIVENLTICAKYIGRHHWAQGEPQGRVKDIIDILVQAFNVCKPKTYSDPEMPIYLGHKRAVVALKQMNSDYVDKLIRKPLNNELFANFFLSGLFAPNQTKNLWEGLAQIVGADQLLEALLDKMYMFSCKGLPEKAPRYFRTIFEIIKRGDFEKKYVKQFNKKLTKWQSDANFMKTYHSSISEFSQDLKSSGSDLYLALEKKGVQFLDSDVYKPK